MAPMSQTVGTRDWRQGDRGDAVRGRAASKDALSAVFGISGERARRPAPGRVGHVLTTLYDEIVMERLYPGKTQLNRCLQELVTEAEQVLNLNPGFRHRLPYM